MKKIALFFLVGILFCSISFALEESYVKDFDEANDLFKSDLYDEALDLYQKISLIKATPEAFYNLGNAAYKEKKLGLSIASYEKAKMLAPRDPDVKHNLRFVKGLVDTKVEDKRNDIIKLMEFISGQWTLIEIQIILFSVLLIAFLWMIIRLLLKRAPMQNLFSKYLITLLCVVIFLTGVKYWVDQYVSYAIVIRKDAPARYGPSLEEKTVFKLAEGLKVRVLESESNWNRVQLFNEDHGWISKDDLEVIKI